jgi:predicted nucleotidyltransferase
MNPAGVQAIANKHGLLLLLRFGSSVTGHLHALSDVNLAVLFGRAPESLGALADLTADLQALVPDRQVDVAVLNHADPLLLKQVTEHCELVYGSPRRLAEFKMYAFKRYQDHRRYLDMERAYVDRAIGAMTR